MTTTPSIWPGPECLDTLGERRRKRHALLMLMGLDWDEALSEINGEHASNEAASERRTRGIALCHAKARASQKAFVPWLLGYMGRRAADEAATFRSPEAWILAYEDVTPPPIDEERESAASCRL